MNQLKALVELWGLNQDITDTKTTLNQIIPAMHNEQNASEMIEVLPVEAQAALDNIVLNHGRMQFPLFKRRYGMLREMGPAQLDRERPYQKPISIAEILWYRGLIARAFFDTPSGAQEFVYIPRELLDVIPTPAINQQNSYGRQALSDEHQQPILANDFILDHACSLLAIIRSGIEPTTKPQLTDKWYTSSSIETVPLHQKTLQSLLATAGLLDNDNQPHPEATRKFLKAARGEALVSLVNTWMESTSFNELRLIPGIIAEGEWKNDPLTTRQAVLGFLSTIPVNKWWSLPAFVEDIRKNNPDFQRPSGDYDSWYLRDTRNENESNYLRGFEHWDDVDGALIRYIICGPLHWLGIIDLAAPSAEHTAPIPVQSFRFSAWSQNLLNGSVPDNVSQENETVTVRSDGQINVPRLAPRSVRYQIARFSEWEAWDGSSYHYRLTPKTLERAAKHGLEQKHLLALLSKSTKTLPPNLVRAIKRWNERGVEAQLEHMLVLRVSTPAILKTLRNSRTARFLGNPLGPTTIEVKPGAWEKVLASLVEMGYLIETVEVDE